MHGVIWIIDIILDRRNTRVYGQGFFVDRWFTDKEMKKLGWEPKTIQERMINILNETLDTNGHIFFVIGKQRILRQSFDSINNKVIR